MYAPEHTRWRTSLTSDFFVTFVPYDFTADLNRSNVELDDLNKELEHLKGLVGQHEEEASSVSRLEIFIHNFLDSYSDLDPSISSSRFQWTAAKNRVDQINRNLELRLEGANDLGEQLDQLREQVRHLEEVNHQQASQLEELRNESGHFTHERTMSSLPSSMAVRLGSEIARLHNSEASEPTVDHHNQTGTEDEADLSTGSVYEIRRTKKVSGLGFWGVSKDVSSLSPLADRLDFKSSLYYSTVSRTTSNLQRSEGRKRSRAVSSSFASRNGDGNLSIFSFVSTDSIRGK